MLPERTCETCKWYQCEAIGDYGSGPYEIRCSLYDQHPDRFNADPEEDENFPYKEAPDCYEVEFWQTGFTEGLDGSQESLDAAYGRFRAFMDHGHPL